MHPYLLATSVKLGTYILGVVNSRWSTLSRHRLIKFHLQSDNTYRVVVNLKVANSLEIQERNLFKNVVDRINDAFTHIEKDLLGGVEPYDIFNETIRALEKLKSGMCSDGSAIDVHESWRLLDNAMKKLMEYSSVADEGHIQEPLQSKPAHTMEEKNDYSSSTTISEIDLKERLTSVEEQNSSALRDFETRTKENHDDYVNKMIEWFKDEILVVFG